MAVRFSKETHQGHRDLDFFLESARDFQLVPITFASIWCFLVLFTSNW